MKKNTAEDYIDANSYYNRGWAMYKLGRYEEAIKDYDQAIRINPNNDACYNSRGWTKYLMRNYNEAVEDCSCAIRLNPKSPYAYDSRGHARLSLNQFEAAIADFNSSISYSSAKDDIVPSLSGRAIANKKLGLDNQAYEDYEKVQKEKCISADDFFERGNAHQSFGNNDAAIRDYESALKVNPNYLPAITALRDPKQKTISRESYRFSMKSGLCFEFSNSALDKLNNGDATGAIFSINNALRLEPNEADAYYIRAMAEESLDRYEEAIKDYNHVIRINPYNNVIVYNERGSAKGYLGRNEEAIEDYDQAIRIKPNYADAYINRGNAKKKLGRNEEAIKDYDHAIQIKSDDAYAYFNRGSAKGHLGRYEEAIKDLDQAIRIKSDFTNAYTIRGLTKYSLGNYEAAIIDYDQVIRIKPDADAYLVRGMTKYSMGHYEAAIIDYDQTIRINPNYTDAYITRGWAKNSLGRYEEALNDFNQDAVISAAEINSAYSGRSIAKKQLGFEQDARKNYEKAQLLECKSEFAYFGRGNAHQLFGNDDAAIKDYESALKKNPNYLPAKTALQNLKQNKKQIDLDFQSESISGDISINFKISYTDLTFDKKIGEGSYGEVYAGTWAYDNVAIKKLKLATYTEESLKELKREAEIMANVRSNHLVQLKGVCLETPNFCLVMELMPKGSLDSLLYNLKQDLPWSLRYQLAADIGVGLHNLHQQGILHRDLKSMNILLTNDNRAKLCDFGLAQIKSSTKVQTRNTLKSIREKSVGTLSWMAPELLNLSPKYSTKSDVYAYAIVMWEIAARQAPYADVGDDSIIKDEVKQGNRAEIPSDIPPSFAKLIKFCWAQNPGERPEVEVVLRELENCKNELKR